MDVEGFINDRRIIHIFSQNCDYNGSSGKVSHLPIGIPFHIVYQRPGWGESNSVEEEEFNLNEIKASLQPTHLRKKRAFVDFQLHDTMRLTYVHYRKYGEDRTSIFQRLLLTGLIDYSSNRMPICDLRRTKGQYAFSISPHGNGLDCHRTWEDLDLGCIVIVKTSPLDPLYEGLPVVIIKDWSEITEKNMELWLKQYGDAFTNPSYREKLTNRYWLKKIQDYALPYKPQT